MTTRDYTEAEEKAALKKIIAEEVRKEKQAQLEQRRRQRQQEQLAQQVEQATSEFESRLAVLRERMAAVTQRQIEWRKRFDAMLSELDALSESQPTIQQEIKSILQDTESAVYEARQKGALIASGTRTHFDAIGGANSDLWPFPADVTNVRYGASNTIANNLALDIVPAKCYRPELTVDSRKRT